MVMVASTDTTPTALPTTTGSPVPHPAYHLSAQLSLPEQHCDLGWRMSPCEHKTMAGLLGSGNVSRFVKRFRSVPLSPPTGFPAQSIHLASCGPILRPSGNMLRFVVSREGCRDAGAMQFPHVHRIGALSLAGVCPDPDIAEIAPLLRLWR